MTWGSLIWLAGVGLASLALSLALVIYLLVQLPSTYFLDSHGRDLWIDQHPLIRWAGVVLKNLTGIGLILLGGVLSIPGIPGQGMLTILIGVVLVDFPGKRRLERAILRQRRVKHVITRLRRRFGKAPFQLDS